MYGLKMFVNSEKFYSQLKHQSSDEMYFSDYDEQSDDREGGGGGGVRRCGRDAATSHAQAPPQAPPPAPVPHQHVKTERLSPHDSNASGSRSVTPSTSSYPSTPPERGSPHHPAPPAPAAPPALAHPPRSCSDMIRALSAKYTHSNEYLHRRNGVVDVSALTSPSHLEAVDSPLGGLYTNVHKLQGSQLRLPALPGLIDMSTTKIIHAICRSKRSNRSRRKQMSACAGVAVEHSPLDLSAGGESAAKRARLSDSPSTRSNSDERDSVSNGDRSGKCLCAEARERLVAWSVDEVSEFVSSIDICAEYASNFREQRIDGAGLPLLTDDHLTGMLQMKLGPALKIRAVIARRLEPCTQCQLNNSSAQVNNSTTPKINGTALKSEPRSNNTSPS